MNVLVLNCGSSSVKFQLIRTDQELMEQDNDRILASGALERIGSQCLIKFEAENSPQHTDAVYLKDHTAAIDYLVKWLISPDHGIPGISGMKDIDAIGHRVVHGGERFQSSVVIDDKVVQGIEDCIELAPLHNPANIAGIRAIKGILGADIPQVAVFDTSFHAAMPDTSFVYAIPYQYYRRYKIRRYGFHGTSYRYIGYRYRKYKGIDKQDVNVMIFHLGNGCSGCAVEAGVSLDTTMGMTPLEGLVMGTRSGNIDPGILEYLSHKEGLDFNGLDNILNKQSGLLGISGLTNDMRELLAEESENGDRRARLAIDIFCKRVRQCIGAYLADMKRCDGIIFTGGIGENSAEVRQRICGDLPNLGIELDGGKNEGVTGGKEGVISSEDSQVEVLVIPTNEELLIARDTVRCLNIP